MKLPAVVLAAALLLVGGTVNAQDKTLIVGMPSVLRHLNPAIQASPVNQVGAQIFASLVRFDKDWTPQPYLAESWTWQDDGKSLLVRLVKGATFHDGKPITSEDVAFSVMAVRASHPFNTMLAPVERVDTPTPEIAIIRLKQEHPALLLALSPALCPIMPKHIYGDGTDLRSHPRNANPVGSGPFKLVNFSPSQSITLQRYENFFIPGQPKVDKLIFRIFADSVSQMLEVERGGIHMATGSITAIQQEQARKFTDAKVVAKGGEAIGPVGWMEFNLRKKPFDDVRVRKAIAYAIDKEFIVKSLHRGATQVATGPIAPGSPHHSATGVEPYKLDLAKAERLLDEAGYKRGADGVRFSFSLDYLPGVPDNYETIANYLKPQLKKVGLNVTVRTSPDFASWGRRVSNWEHDASVSGAFMWGDPVIGIHRSWVSTNIRKGVPFSNTPGYNSPKVDDLLTRAGTERDLAKRKKLYAEFQQQLSADMPVAFTHVWSRVYIARKEVLNPPTGIWGLFSPYDQIDMSK
jgi:peptide/nickel transport system substrate-binding protein